MSTLINTKETNLNKPEVSGVFETSSYINNNCINSLDGDLTNIITINSNKTYSENIWLESNPSEYLNKDNTSIQVPALQLNPGVTLE